MRKALLEAKKAFELNEVPVGAVVECNGKIVGKGHNLVEKLKDPTAHAEILAIKEAARNLGDWRLDECNIFVTLEPCLMCAGAIFWSRIKAIYFGLEDPENGAILSSFDFNAIYARKKPVLVSKGILKNQIRSLMLEFFKKIRTE